MLTSLSGLGVGILGLYSGAQPTLVYGFVAVGIVQGLLAINLWKRNDWAWE